MKITEVKQRGTAADRNALRKEQAPTSRGPVDRAVLKTLPEQIPEACQRAGLFAAGLLSDADGPELQVVVDPEVTMTAETYVKALSDAPTSDPVGAAVSRLKARLPKWRRAEAVQAAVTQLAEDLADTDRTAGKREQALQGEFFRIVHALLFGTIGDLTLEERDQLAAKTARARAMRDQAQSETKTERGKTLDAKAEAKGLIEAGDAEAQMMDTAVALSTGRAVADEELDEALATFAAYKEKRKGKR